MIENAATLAIDVREPIGKVRTVNRAQLSKAFFYVAFAVYCAVLAISRTTLESILGLSVDAIVSFRQPIVLIFLALSILLTKKRPWQWAIIAVVVVIAFVSWKFSHENWLFWAALFIISSKGIRIKPLAWITLTVSVSIILMSVVCSLTGVIENIVVIRQGAERYSMGFTHPNTFGAYLLGIALSISVIRFGRNPLPDLIVLAIIIAVSILVTDSRATMIVALSQGILLLVFYFVTNEKVRRVLSSVMLVGIVLLVVASIFFMLFFNANSHVHTFFDGLFSTRFSLAHGYFEMAPLTPFGNSFEGYSPIVWDNGEPVRFVVDNAYCHLVLAYGLIPTIVFFEVFFTYYAELLRHRRWDVILFGLTIMAIYAFVETMGIRISSNFFLIGMGAELFYGGNMLSGGKHAGIARVETPEPASPRGRI